MSISAALQLAYAANPKGPPPLETLELDNPTFDQPARLLVAGGGTDISLPLVLSGTPQLFLYCPATVTLPGVTKDGPTPMKIRVQNVTRHLWPYLQLAEQASAPITLTYRVYAATDLTQPAQVLSGFHLRTASVDAYSVEATVHLKEIEMQAFPLATYDEQYYPTLQNA